MATCVEMIKDTNEEVAQLGPHMSLLAWNQVHQEEVLLDHAEHHKCDQQDEKIVQLEETIAQRDDEIRLLRAKYDELDQFVRALLAVPSPRSWMAS